MSDNGKHYSGLVVFVSSHGDGGKNEGYGHFEVIRAYDKYYHKSNLWKSFASKTGWKGKPLLFFFQACRGEDGTVGVTMTNDSSIEKSEHPSYHSLPKMSNLFILNATQPGAVAIRKMPEGNSLFVDILCETFTNHAITMDLLSMAVMICRSVAEEFENCCKVQDYPPGKMDCSMQMPSFESKLELKLYLAKDFKQEIYTEQFFKSESLKGMNKPKDNATVLFLNYSTGGRDRIKSDTDLLKTCFLENGYNCLEKWNATYEQYVNLSKF